MTLIFITEKDSNLDVFGGDILVSVEVPNGQHKIFLPLQPNIRNFATRNGELKDLRQKICRINDSLYVLWAGELIVARFFVEKLKATDCLGELYEAGIAKFLQYHGLSDREIESVSLIVLACNESFGQFKLYHNCDSIIDGEETFKVAGSGKWHFFVGLNDEDDQVGVHFTDIERHAKSQGVAREMMLFLLLNHRLIKQTISEGISKESLEFFYGGRIDLFFCQDGIVEHLPTMMKIWHYENGEFNKSGGLIITGRSGTDLTITTSPISTMEQKLTPLCIAVPQLDDDKPVRRLLEVNAAMPDTQIHIVSKAGHSEFEFIFLPTSQKKYQISFENDVLEENCSEEFYEFLHDVVQNNFGE